MAGTRGSQPLRFRTRKLVPKQPLPVIREDEIQSDEYRELLDSTEKIATGVEQSEESVSRPLSRPCSPMLRLPCLGLAHSDVYQIALNAQHSLDHLMNHRSFDTDYFSGISFAASTSRAEGQEEQGCSQNCSCSACARHYRHQL